MFKKLALSLMTFAVLGAAAFAQQPAVNPIPGAFKYPRGHKELPQSVKDQRHAVMGKRHKAVHDGLTATLSLPASYTCTQFCTPAENQGRCGSCWDFSGTEVNESANIKAGYLPNTVAGQLSAQYTLDQCPGIQNGGCDGDDNTTVLAGAKQSGIPLAADYTAYQAQAGQCSSCSGTPPILLYVLSDWGYVSGQSGIAPVALIKAALMQYGPIGCGVSAGGEWDSYSGGNAVITAGGFGVNHDVVITGWDDSKQAFQVRNSWGTGWGNNGYCWVGYTACQIGSEAVWAVASPPVTLPPAPAPTTLTAGPASVPAGTYSVLLKSGGLFGKSITVGSVTSTVAAQYTVTLTPMTSKRTFPTPAKK
jgi:C1A family cysteine protease